MENKIKSFEDYRLKNFIDIDDLKNKLEKYLELMLPINDELAILEQQKRDVSSAYNAWNAACKMKDEEIEALKNSKCQCGNGPNKCTPCKEESVVLYSRIKTNEGVVLVRQDDKEMQKVVGLVYELDIENHKLQKENEELNGKIEKMKCCGNCQRRYDGACYEHDNLCVRWSLVK